MITHKVLRLRTAKDADLQRRIRVLKALEALCAIETATQQNWEEIARQFDVNVDEIKTTKARL